MFNVYEDDNDNNDENLKIEGPWLRKQTLTGNMSASVVYTTGTFIFTKYSGFQLLH